MIDLPTPETDAVAEKNIYGVACKVDVDFARKLERERDEALERERVAILSFDEERQRALREGERVLEARREMSEQPTPRTDSAIMEIPSKFDSICVVRVELALDLERELGEALDDLQVLRSNKMSDPLLETTFKNIIRERDETKEKMADALQEVDLRTLDFERMKKERDEARGERDAWRNHAERFAAILSDETPLATIGTDVVEALQKFLSLKEASK